MSRFAAMAALAAVVLSAPLAAQKPPVKDSAKVEKMDHSKMDHSKMDHSKMGQSGMQHGADHAASGWKELDSYHMLMMQTYHPIKEKGDVAPIRARSTEMVAAAKLVAASKAPARCDTPALRKAAAGLVGETQRVANLVAKKGSDKALVTAMTTLHDRFEVLEKGCASASHE
jgi:uncharacterized protein involved in copper resistance